MAELDSGEETVLGKQVPQAGDQSRRVRAPLIRLLLLEDDDAHRLHEKGLRIAGAWITDLLDLEGCCDLRDIALLDCRFAERPLLRSVELSNLYLKGSSLPGLSADGLEAKGDVSLQNVDATGEVRLLGATLGGELSCTGARFRAEKDAKGNPGYSLSADGLEAKRGVFLQNVDATGTVRLLGATLGGDLSCSEARFRAEKDARGNRGNALHADRLIAKGSVFLRNVDATGQVRLLGARLGGNLSCVGAKFRAEKDAEGNPGDALNAAMLEAAGGAYLRDGFEATGKVWLVGAKLGGDLDCVDATFHAVRDVSGNLGSALAADGIETGGSVFLRRGVLSGRAVITSAQIGGNLDCRGAHDGGDGGVKLDLRGTRVEGVFLAPAPIRSGGWIALDGAHVRAFDVCTRALAVPTKVRLNRFTYDGLVGESVDVPVADWLAFLAKQYRDDDPADFYPQPYEQLAKVLREAGHGEEARTVLIEKERRQRAALLERAPLEARGLLRLRDRVLWHTMRYGRQPLRAALWLTIFWAFGTVVFFGASDFGAIKPNNPVTLRSEEWVDCRAVEGRARVTCFEATDRGASYPRFNALIYSADALVPIVSLEMQEYWIPDEATLRGQWARWYLWLHIALGWALSLLAVAGFSGLVKSD